MADLIRAYNTSVDPLTVSPQPSGHALDSEPTEPAPAAAHRNPETYGRRHFRSDPQHPVFCDDTPIVDEDIEVPDAPAAADEPESRTSASLPRAQDLLDSCNTVDSTLDVLSAPPDAPAPSFHDSDGVGIQEYDVLP